MFHIIVIYLVTIFLASIIVLHRNDIFYYDSENDKIEFKRKDLLGSIYIWFIIGGIIIFYL